MPLDIWIRQHITEHRMFSSTSDYHIDIIIINDISQQIH